MSSLRPGSIVRTETNEFRIQGPLLDDEFKNSFVWTAFNLRDGRKCVCKELRYDEPSSQNPDRELEAHRDLSQHWDSHLVTRFDFCAAPPTRCGPTYYLFFEYYNGGDLIEFLRRCGRGLPEPVVRLMGRHILEALASMHGVGWAHRDVKPDNILVAGSPEAPQAFLTDLGHAGRIPQDGPFPGDAPFGTPGYLAPELICGEQYGPNVDIWALGVTIYIMLTYKLPFPSAKDYPGAHKEWVLAGEYFTDPLEEAGVSEQGKRTIAWMLSVNPDVRPTASELLDCDYFNVSDEELLKQQVRKDIEPDDDELETGPAT